MSASRDSAVGAARRQAAPLHRVEDLDPLLERIGSARYVLLGESTHGTSDFYRWRAELTKRLLIEQGFSFVAVEGDWPDSHRLHQCLVGDPEASDDPQEVLESFNRWPRWMWANDEVVEFADWLRQFNAGRFSDPPVGFHGLDVYSLWDSLHEILDYLRKHEPGYVSTGLAALRCFESYGGDLRGYGTTGTARSVDVADFDDPGAVVPDGCADDVVRLLTQVRREAGARSGLDEQFVAWQNAEIVAGAERYYREMLRGGVHSWNVRDRHMADTLARLEQTYGQDAKAVIWAHNTHIGDARATDMADTGMLNLGQLMRERQSPGEVVTVGFGTHHGTVIAADTWGARPRRMLIPPARPGSFEALLHEAVPDADSLLLFHPDADDWSQQVWDHRAIGVVYRPERERYGNYVPTVPARRYDAFVYCDSTSALTPLSALAHQPVLPA